MPSRQSCCCSGVEPRLFARHLEKNRLPASFLPAAASGRVSLFATRAPETWSWSHLLLPAGPASGRAHSGPRSTPGQFRYVIAAFHPLQRHQPERFGIPVDPLLGYFAAPLPAKCRNSTCLILGGQSTHFRGSVHKIPKQLADYLRIRQKH